MPSFPYEALDASGARTSGQVDARDRSGALAKISKLGLRPFSVGSPEDGNDKGSAPSTPKSSKTSKASKISKANAAAKREAASKDSVEDEAPTGNIKLNRSQLVFFTEELSEMLLAGVRLEAALGLLERRAKVKPIRDVSGHIRANIRNGSSFSKALEAASPSFGSLYCNLAAAGEAGGSLGDILQRQSGYLTKMAEVRGKVLVSMIYPSFLLFSGVIVVVLFLTFLLPKLVVLLEGGGGELPPLASFLLKGTEIIRESWWLMLLIIVTLTAAIWLFVKGSPDAQAAWDRLKLRIPVFGKVLRTRFHVQFLETMGNLLGSGVTLLQALQLSRAATANSHHQVRLGKVVDQVREGEPLSNCLEASAVFPGQLVDLVRVGEETGDLDRSMKRAAVRYDKELDRSITGITALIQPAIILVMAAVVGTVAYLMISIIYDTVNTLRTR